MLKKIKTSDLKPGQIFSAPVFSEDDYLLVPQLVPIRQKEINLLLTWGIEEVTTEGSLVEKTEEPEVPEELLPEELPSEDFAPGDYSSDDYTSDDFSFGGFSPDGFNLDNFSFGDDTPAETPPAEAPPEEAAAKKATIKFSIRDVRQNSGPYRAYKSVIDKIAGIFNGIKSGVDIQMKAIDNICVQLLQDLRDYPDNFLDYILGGEVTGNELAKSSVNTAILAALTAQELKLPNHKIHNVIAGALLHDVGMLRLSKGITEKKGGLSDAELEQIKSHPVHTSKIVTKELYGPREVNLIALHHHERWDGKGYPDQLAGQAIDIGARIVSVADAFEAMVSKKSYRNSIVGYQAVKNLLADNGRRFDPDVIIAFTKIVGIYPIGSIVRLNDTSIARVTSLHTEAPLRPFVQMLMDNKGNVLNSKEIYTVDLLDDRSLFIKSAVDPAEFDINNE
jgi:HD-GYP domain-containing protein (c-di-GMP phosphodiesterase class II)